jgi:hypothetical protein
MSFFRWWVEGKCSDVRADKILLKERYYNKTFQASNCGYEIDWKPFIQMKGTPKKQLLFSKATCSKGNDYYKFDLEGKFYGLSPQIRKQLDTNSKASIFYRF